MNETLRQSLVALLVAALVVMVIIGLIGLERMHIMKEDFAALEQVLAELQQTVDILEMDVGMFKDHEILLMVGNGREVIIHTMDGRELRCYFPNQERYTEQ